MDKSDELLLITQYKYKISISILFSDELVDLKPPQVSYIAINNDYIKNFFPICKVKLILSYKHYKKIQVEKNTVKFKINIVKVPIAEDVKPEEAAIDALNMTGEDVLTDAIFEPHYIPVDADTNEKLDNDLRDFNDENPTSLESDEFNTPLEIFLFSSNHLNANKKIFNTVLENVDMVNAIGYLLNQSNFDSVIMDMPNNSKTYSQVLIPPFNFRNSLRYLQNVFGIYKNGLITYADFKYLYIIANDTSVVNIPSGDYESVLFHIIDNTDADLIKTGVYIDKDNSRYVIRLNNIVSVENRGQINKEIIGNKLRVLSFEDIKNSCSYNYKSDTFSYTDAYKTINMEFDGNDNDDKVKYYYNNYDNPYLNDDMIKQSQSSNQFLSFSYNDFDYNLFTPNKRYLFEFGDIPNKIQYNGRYTLVQSFAVFDKATGGSDELFSYSGTYFFRFDGKE